MSTLLQTLVTGAVSGLVIGGLALALAVVYQGSGILNFAQGQFATVSAYISWQLISWGLPFWAALLISAAASFVLGAAVQQIFIRPVQRSDELSILIVTVGLLLIADSLVGSIWGFLPKSIGGPFGDAAYRLGGAVVTAQMLAQVTVLVVAVAAVSLLFGRTSIGLRMRAAAAAPESAQLSGIDLSRTLALGWGVAAAVGAVAGTVSAPVTGLSPDVNSSTLLLAFAAAAFGGFHSRAGAVAGGVLVGVATALAGGYLPGVGNDLRLLVPLVLIVLVLLIAPDGVFARRRAVRV
ncbi:branched-chain amino acid ABC transporter permease [Actinoallomurus acanthiterrae]